MKSSSGADAASTLAAIVAAARRRKAPLRSAEIPRFLERYYRFAPADDLLQAPPGLAAQALSQLSWAATRRAGAPLVRAFNPTEEADGFSTAHTIVQTVTDDSPFIVDSLTMHLNAATHGVLAKIHSVIPVHRDARGRLRKLAAGSGDSGAKRESWVHFEIPRIVDASALRQLERELKARLGDVRLATRDWPAMIDALREAAEDLRFSEGRDREIVEESSRFLEWLADNHFTLLGLCEFRSRRRGKRTDMEPIAGTGLGLLRPRRKLQGVLSWDLRQRHKAGAGGILTIAKAPLQSTVHRPAPFDDICINRYDRNGNLRGAVRVLGLFTSVAYNESPHEIPLLRLKVEQIIERSELDTGGHRGKALRHILVTLPRDELIQASIAELEAMSLGILALEERRKVRLFHRRDAYGNFYSCLVYLPRDQYSRPARQRIESLLQETFGGHVADSQVTLSESSLARLTVMIRSDADTKLRIDSARLQRALEVAAATWTDRVRDALLERLPETDALTLHRRLTERFSVAYQEALEPSRAVEDMPHIAALIDGDRELDLVLVRASTSMRFTAFQRERPIELFRANPILENMGVKVQRENNYSLKVEGMTVWIQDFELESPPATALDPDQLAAHFQQCFEDTLRGLIENDSFNRLVIDAGLSGREVALLRAYCKYLLQTGLRFSQSYMLETLRRHPKLVRALVRLFECRFDPDGDARSRKKREERHLRTLASELDRAVNLDDDRILRAFVGVVQATQRTNAYQTGNGTRKEYVSFKLDPSRIPELPKPRPKHEIFVYSRRVEGVHLRCGDIARGGLRWSDRREDFRTEVLGLMKAQQVKNTVIVPSGAKGGFVCKQLPSGDRAAVQAEVVACYQTFVRGMLDITDNIVDGETVTPERVVCRDGRDPYLVVAADKGTASFSDTANALAAEYGYWLGDAFASGGSAGYDHKKMGITARGAWESVKRHFREMGTDTQSQDFSVIGIGDMSGDVFGNGMLLSPHIRLLAAFNHQHIFIDPDPDPATSFAERKRLFELPRSTWLDYGEDCLSKGGGIYERSAKSIKLSPQARAMLKIEAADLSPPELIRAILKAPADLLWNGGIGTYVKASHESHQDAGDPANDSVRVDGKDLRAKVVAEGGNLGLTQLGRVEYALAGGRINTDFIDNSAGVDSSDREVNIKILLNDAIEAGLLQPGRRNALLARMTDAVAELVLASNYAQTQSLSMMDSRGGERLGEHARLMRNLESRGLLDRSIEFLPNEEMIEERKKRGLGLTRPELAVILSYAKIQLYESLVATKIPDEPYCARELVGYFPHQLAPRFEALMGRHRLRRQIAAMLIASSMINRMGPSFMIRAQEDTGADTAEVTSAYAIVRNLFSTRKLWRDIEALDGQVQAAVQYDSFFEASRMVRRAVYWFLHRFPHGLAIADTIERFGPTVTEVLEVLPRVLAGVARRRFERDTREFESLGVPSALGQRVATLRLMTQVLDIAALSLEHAAEPAAVAKLHFEVGRGLRLDWLRDQIEELDVEGHWRAMARGTLRETLGQEQRAILGRILRRAAGGQLDVALADWLTRRNAQIVRMKQTFEEMQSTGQMDFATLSIALKELSRLTNGAKLG